jgi:PHP family Zn ribbon phosphoesterase
MVPEQQQFGHSSSSCWACFVALNLDVLATAHRRCSGSDERMERDVTELVDRLSQDFMPPHHHTEPFYLAAAQFAQIIHPLSGTSR